MSDRLPWFPFETVAWRGDLTLRTCSLSARAVWLEMLTVMHEAAPRGYLRVNGQPIDAEGLASLMSAKPREVAKAMEELDEKRVFSRTSDGVIYSRKMVRDEKRREGDRNRQQSKRDRDSDVTRDIHRDNARDVTPSVTNHVTDTGARGIARQSFRDQRSDQNPKSTAPGGAGCAQPVEKSDDADEQLRALRRRIVSKQVWAGLSHGDQHSLLCVMAREEMDAGRIIADSADDIEHLKTVAAKSKFDPVTSRQLVAAVTGVLQSRGLPIGA